MRINNSSLVSELLGGADAAQKIVERVGIVDAAARLGLGARNGQSVDAEHGAHARVVGAVGVVRDIADEGEDRHAPRSRAARHAADDLALSALRVDAALAGEDEVGVREQRVEADHIEHDLNAGAQLRAQQGDAARAEAARRARAGERGDRGAQLTRKGAVERAELTVEQGDRRRVRALLRREDVRRAVGAVHGVGDVAHGGQGDAAQLLARGGDVDVRDAINAGKYPGPRLLTSGVGVTVPGGHGAGLFAHIAETPEQAREIVRECFARKCDLVKLFITGGVFDAEKEGEPGVLRMSPEIAAAAVDEAHKLGMATAAHIESAEGVRVGLEAGVDTIEHGADLTPELIALFKENGVGRKSSLTCTVSPALPFVELDPEKTHSTEIQKVNGNIVYQGIVRAAQAALKAGIPVGLGTDSACPYVTHYDMWREVVYFERIVGAPRKLALHTATLGNARILGLGEETGSIEVGKAADLIVLDENPLDNLEALRQVKMVMARGKLVSGLSVKHLPELDRELDTFLPRG